MHGAIPSFLIHLRSAVINDSEILLLLNKVTGLTLDAVTGCTENLRGLTRCTGYPGCLKTGHDRYLAPSLMKHVVLKRCLQRE